MMVSGGVVSRVLSGWNVKDTWSWSRLVDGTTGGSVNLKVDPVYIGIIVTTMRIAGSMSRYNYRTYGYF